MPAICFGRRRPADSGCARPRGRPRRSLASERRREPDRPVGLNASTPAAIAARRSSRASRRRCRPTRRYRAAPTGCAAPLRSAIRTRVALSGPASTRRRTLAARLPTRIRSARSRVRGRRPRCVRGARGTARARGSCGKLRRGSCDLRRAGRIGLPARDAASPCPRRVAGLAAAAAAARDASSGPDRPTRRHASSVGIPDARRRAGMRHAREQRLRAGEVVGGHGAAVGKPHGGERHADGLSSGANTPAIGLNASVGAGTRSGSATLTSGSPRRACRCSTTIAMSVATTAARHQVLPARRRRTL